MIERQVIVTWHTPEKKLPPEGEIVIATVSGRVGGKDFDHVFALAKWKCKWSNGWSLVLDDMEEFTIHAWCDLEPYKG